MAGTASLAKFAALHMSDVGTTNPVRAFAYERFAGGCGEQLIDTGSRVNWGTLSRPVKRVRKNRRVCQPQIDLVPNFGEWENLLQWVQGGSPTTVSADGTTTITYPLANAAAERVVRHNDGFVTTDMTDVAVDRATLRGVQQQEVTLSLDCVGRNWVTPSQYNPTAGRDTAPSLLFTDLVVSVAGTNTYKCRAFELDIFKNIDRDRFFNSNVLSGTIARDRVVGLTLDLPWGLHYALWQTGAATDGDGLAVVLTFSFVWLTATYTLTVTMPKVKANTDPVEYRVPDEVFYPWQAQAFSADGGAPNFALSDELVFTLARPT